ncbi:uncharacterized protein [Hetaerina americana]|uniref:uncharacterized protein n=1 Tax=Hetaerina americana TaxID=62018 RepID=UPI003A7F4335
MDLILLIAVATVLGVERAATRDIRDHLDFPEPPSDNLEHPGSSLVRKRRFFDDGDDLESIERHLEEEIGAVCPAAKRWFDSHDGGHPGGPKTLGHGDAVHLALKIRRLKKAYTTLCHPPTRRPHKPPGHKPRPPTHRPPYRPPYRPPHRPPYDPLILPPTPSYVPYPPLGGGLPLTDEAARNLQIRRHVIRPLRRWFGWPVGAIASAFLLR